MRMSRRMGLLAASKPTLQQLFANVNSVDVAGLNANSATSLSKSLPSSAVEGDTWYYFFFAGGSLEIARIDYSSGAISKTQLATVKAEDATQQTFSVSGTTATSVATLYGGNFVCLRFGNKYATSAIDALLSQSLKSCVKYAYGSSIWANSNARIKQSDTAGFTGICFVAFMGNTSYSSTGGSNNWSISNWETPFVPIISYQNNSALSRTVIMSSTASSIDYYSPTLNGTNTTVYGHSYSMFRLY